MSPCEAVKIGDTVAFITYGGEPIRIATNAGTVAFEWHDYFGPMPVSMQRGREGEERVLNGKHDFWQKVTLWCRQGRRTERVGKKLWATVDAAKACESCHGTGRGRHLGGRNYSACPDCEGPAR